MAGEFWLDADGKRVFADSGKTHICDSCPCGCPDCPNSLTPARQYEVTLSGFDSRLCTSCDQCGGFAGPTDPSRKMLTLNIDGTYTVPFDSNLPGRQWYYLYLGVVGTHQHYAELNCGGYNGINNVTADIRIYCNHDLSGNQTSIDIDIYCDYQLSRCNIYQPFFFQTSGLDCLGYGESHTGLTDSRVCGTESPVSGGGTVDIEVVA